jgi:hypothetical protein
MRLPIREQSLRRRVEADLVLLAADGVYHGLKVTAVASVAAAVPVGRVPTVLVALPTVTGDNIQYNWPRYCPDIARILRISGQYPGYIRTPYIVSVITIYGVRMSPGYCSQTILKRKQNTFLS